MGFGCRSPGGDPAGVGGSAGEMANGRQLYNYLLKNLFGGNKIAAAGAIASIWGESTWNPFAQGTGGRGLIGWTPGVHHLRVGVPGRHGHPATGDSPVRYVQRRQRRDRSDVPRHLGLAGRHEWGRGVERFGINDVHPQGLALAKQIAGLKAGGRVKAYANGGMITEPVIGIGASGQAYSIGENGPERVTPMGQDPQLARIIALLDMLAGRIAGGVAKAMASPQANMA